MSQDNTVDAKNEKLLEDLKLKAEKLGVDFNPRIGFDKLKAKVDLALKEMEEGDSSSSKSVGPNKSVLSKEEAARKPVLAIVHELDSNQQGDPTIVSNIGNRYFKIGCITQKGKEQLIPAAVIASLKAKTRVIFEDVMNPVTKRPTGNKVAKTVPRFNIEIIDANPKV